jgi:hypothetical protein
MNTSWCKQGVVKACSILIPQWDRYDTASNWCTVTFVLKWKTTFKKCNRFPVCGPWCSGETCPLLCTKKTTIMLCSVETWPLLRTENNPHKCFNSVGEPADPVGYENFCVCTRNLDRFRIGSHLGCLILKTNIFLKLFMASGVIFKSSPWGFYFMWGGRRDSNQS